MKMNDYLMVTVPGFMVFCESDDGQAYIEAANLMKAAISRSMTDGGGQVCGI